VKKLVQVVLLTSVAIGVSYGQASTRSQKKIEVGAENDVAQAIIAREEGFWDAWKNNRPDFFRENLTEDSVVVLSGGPKGKPQILAEILKSDCVIK
jgi:hypothetical protein